MTPSGPDDRLAAAARRLRRTVLDAVHARGGGHIGGMLSLVEILTALYYDWLRLDGGDDRDRCLLSKGHCALLLYQVLAERGLLPAAELEHAVTTGSELCAHPEYRPEWGIEATAGSLGHGLALGSGIAYALARRGSPARTVVILGDGECQEGSVWEAALFAARHRLGNLLAVVDHNGLQAIAPVSDVVSWTSPAALWSACGWRTIEVDGHDPAALCAAFAGVAPGTPPLAVIARTVKGKGVSFMEDAPLWHYRAPDAAEYARACRELDP